MEKSFKVRILDLVKDDLVEENCYPRIDFDLLSKLVLTRLDSNSRIIIDLNH